MSSRHSLTKLSLLLIGCTLLPAGSFAQLTFQPSQPVQFYFYQGFVFHGDFNNDGREDLIVNEFVPGVGGGDEDLLYLSNGDGTYGSGSTLPALIWAIGDFNGDGNLDFASVNTSTSSITAYLGVGNGEFLRSSTVTGPNNVVSLIAVDLNHDGKTDLVEVADGPPVTIQTWISNGSSNGSSIFNGDQTIVVGTGPLAQQTVSGAVTGDFDGDDNPDIALLYDAPPSATTVQVWYGDGAGHLGTPYLITDPNKYIDIEPIAGDLNNNGRSDIVSIAEDTAANALPTLSVFAGNANRTMSYSNIATNQAPSYPAVADFNGDGLNDLAYYDYGVAIRLGKGSGSFDPEQVVNQGINPIYQLYASRTTLGTKPDIVFLGSNGGTSASITVLTNTSDGDFPGCGVSFAEGVTVCTPGASATSPVKFSVGAAGPTPMRTAAVWADGKKVAEQLTHAFSNYSFLDASVPLAAGKHSITVFGTGWDDTLQKKSFTLTVVSCSAPTVPGVHICQPASGATVSSPVAIQAVSAVTGKFDRMEVWVDDVKKYSETSGTTVNTTLSLAAGSHRFAVIATNTAGTKWENAVDATVK